MSASWCYMRKFYREFSVKLYKPLFGRTSFYDTPTCRFCSTHNKNKKDTERKRAKSQKGPVTYESEKYDVPTEPGAKKDVSCPLPRSYSPEFVEAAWYDWWVDQGFFTPEYGSERGTSREKFVMCLPPPNVTGTLHLGHAITNTIQDALVRWHRMRGYETLWVPGCDHAGIATQVVVEKRLWKERRTTRHNIGRDAFVQEVWNWKQSKGETIYDQMKKLGSSLDWSRACFTLDKDLSKAVTEAFVSLHDDGLIYRKNRMVNWSCQLQSVISDIEVENVSLTKRTHLNIPGYQDKVEFGTLTSFAYPVVGKNEEIVVSTTRPETMLGDTAVAVHPLDSRYQHLHGCSVQHPIDGRLLPIICDDFVDMEFGTGAVKITPAHDKTDHEIGQRHGLPSMSVISRSGIMENVGDIYTGVKRFDARKLVVEDLKRLNLYRGTKSHAMTIPICSRSKDVIEPLAMEQWFVNMEEMSAMAINVVKSKKLSFVPEYHGKVWFNWLKDSQEWCISRQLWWGHRIPAYQAYNKNEGCESSIWVVAKTPQEALTKAAQTLNTREENIVMNQDEDVLDTWFSSALFPFSPLGWPNQTKDLEKYYPISLMETGSDILFFWVARMVMLGLKLTNQLPFPTILLHGLLRDAHGRKMSKSLGNVIDPIDVISGITLEELHKKVEDGNLSPQEVQTAKEGQRRDFPNGIPACGTDALRYMLCSYDFKDDEIPMNVDHVQARTRFCNKIWNSFKFVTSYADSAVQYNTPIGQSGDLMDQWILSRLSNMVEICHEGFQSYDLQFCTKALQNFWLSDFCDVYLEYSKSILNGENSNRKEATKQILCVCVDVFIRGLSPFMPYLSEELYQRLPIVDKAVSVCVAKYPDPADVPYRDTELESLVERVRAIATHVLSVATRYSIKSKQLKVYVRVPQESHLHTPNVLEALQIMTRCKSVEVITEEIPVECTVYHLDNKTEIGIILKGVIDVDMEIEKINQKLGKLGKKMDQLIKSSEKASKMTSQKKQKLQTEILETEEMMGRLRESIEELESMRNKNRD
ncbi:valine--tRNA ligase-like [Saccostrea echinata]|uniref:valine--tRNA ligase-like n=1 Tax=Saccostrea echinata TaxID=191078 RepID=UPI002A838973|nr:valine--tRNA ligase-like [Saccostrea echinata]